MGARSQLIPGRGATRFLCGGDDTAYPAIEEGHDSAELFDVARSSMQPSSSSWAAGLTREGKGCRRIFIEKPFGRDLQPRGLWQTTPRQVPRLGMWHPR